MSPVARTVDATILRNRGIPIQLHALTEREGGGYDRAFADGEAQFDEVYLSFNNSVLADIEGFFGDLDGWQDALDTQPRRALTQTMAFALEHITIGPDGKSIPDTHRTGKAMIDGESAAYSTAIGAAYMIAEGIPPEKAGEVLAAGLKGIEEGKEEAGKLDVKALLMPDDEDQSADHDTPTDPPESTTGPPSTQDGSKPGETSTSSGDEPPPRSSS